MGGSEGVDKEGVDKEPRKQIFLSTFEGNGDLLQS